MIGYKVFQWNKSQHGGLGWNGPFYSSPSEWKIKQGAILTSPDINVDAEQDCGCGINFFQTLKDAQEFVREYQNDDECYVIYKLETTTDATVVKVIVPANICVNFEHWKLARATKVKLVKRVGLYLHGKKVSKKR